ncbi:hypothetical protein [Acidisphaera sp. S103]|uniref:hypothetical protein n=1 Tax=Acidisphaera sp. S103 TaxID=1747223 RepID=UPI00131B8C9F|nr:hypothetical protein [Acidisphaera sp. S103]
MHCIRHGEQLGRRPHPVFDPAWYRSVYDVPAEWIALGHYLANRGSGLVVPNAGLFAVPWMVPYRDDPAIGVDPVAHYLDDVAADGLEAFPDPGVVRGSGLVDENFYLIHGTDVLQANLDPSDHYCRYGWRENRRPNIYFDPDWYLLTNPEVARLGVNPLVHYILVGEPGGAATGGVFRSWLVPE